MTRRRASAGVSDRRQGFWRNVLLHLTPQAVLIVAALLFLAWEFGGKNGFYSGFAYQSDV